MSDKIKLEVAFWQKVKYSGIIQVTKEQAELLLDEDSSDIIKYQSKRGEFVENPLWDLLKPVAVDLNLLDWYEEFEDLEISKID